MKILGFQSGHDVSYCVLKDGVPVIHEELERFIREKEPKGDGLKMAFERLPDDLLDGLDVFCYGNLNTRHQGSVVNEKEYAHVSGCAPRARTGPRSTSRSRS